MYVIICLHKFKYLLWPNNKLVRFAAHPRVTAVRARVWENHINILMKLGGMIQYGRVDLDLAAYDVKCFRIHLDFGHLTVRIWHNFPASRIKYTLHVWQASDAFFFLCQIFSTPTASMVRSFPRWKLIIFANGKMGTVKRFVLYTLRKIVYCNSCDCIVLCGNNKRRVKRELDGDVNPGTCPIPKLCQSSLRSHEHLRHWVIGPTKAGS